MKDLFLPIILFVVTMTAGVIFLKDIYKPQRRTLSVIAENEYKSQVAITKITDGNNEIVSGNIVNSTIDYYSMDGDKKVEVIKGNKKATYITENSNNTPHSGFVLNIDISEEYAKEISRDKSTNNIKTITFIKK